MLPWKNKRNIVFAVTGGISAYKVPEILRALLKEGSAVEIVMTEEAENFVSPLVLSTLLAKPVWRQVDFLSPERGWEIPHVTLADWADLIIVAPATADSLARAAQGEAWSLLGALLLAAKCPVLFFPAMNVHMWEHPATKSNVAILADMGYRIAEPESGDLACGYNAKGRLPSKEAIMHEIWKTLCPSNDLRGKKVLVTAGPTWEFLDPVRFLSNPSSGKMGFAMARTAWYRGANVTVVCGPVSFPDTYGLTIIPVVSAMDMLEAVLSELPAHEYIVKAAAVGDYRSASISQQKIKRSDRGNFTLELVQNPDIAFQIGTRKKTGQILIGFAAESQDLVKNASVKMEKKNLDFIIANDITASDAGFQSDTNKVQIMRPSVSGPVCSIEGTKEEVAFKIWDIVMAKNA